jgi:hypothetical protein
MLEGQVAILSSGRLNEKETSDLMKGLFNSELWREDQQSFMLYPFVELPDFLEKNIIPANLVRKSLLLQKLLYIGNRQIIRKDENGGYHFNADLKSISVLKNILESLPPEADKELIKTEKQLIYDIYEYVFQHRFLQVDPGRSINMRALGLFTGIWYQVIAGIGRQYYDIFINRQ